MRCSLSHRKTDTQRRTSHGIKTSAYLAALVRKKTSRMNGLSMFQILVQKAIDPQQLRHAINYRLNLLFYKSASEHTKIKRKLPPQLLFVPLIFLSLPILIYLAYSNVFAKNIVIDDEVDIIIENQEDTDPID